MKEIMTSIFCRVVGGGEYLFQEGDDELRTSTETLQAEAFSALISAYLFNDTVSASWAKYLEYAHTDSPLLLILRSTGVDESLDRFEQLPLIRYMGGFRSELIVHTSHEANAVSVTMKIGEKSSGGHDHADSGSFQIYYNALLAGDSGVYDSFNSTHHKNYHRATIAHNSIIVYRDGVALGQRTVGEPNMQQWTDGTCETGTTTGVSYGYADAEMTIPVYGYLAGDISAAYSGNLEKADRRMLAVFDTDNPEIPMYFFVYDNITTYDANDRKTFLLHIKTPPTIDGKTVTVNCGSGRLVLQNVHGASTVEGIGGNDNNFVVNGYQVPTSDGSTDGYWGRIEISPSIGSLNNSMLNVMYVTKASSKATATATRIKNNYVVGSIIGNTAAVFVESAEKIDEQFYFTATGSGELNYYVSGVAAGTWNVRVGSTNVNIVVSEESGLLTFTAPAGMVNITPVN
jgi:heparin/heparan-sulfate lyase